MILLYDNVSTGHHPGYIGGIVEAAERTDHPFLLAAVERPSGLADVNRWIKVDPAPPRAIRSNRRQMARASRSAAARGATCLVDLYLDKQIWAADAGRRHLTTSVHVLHHAEQYSTDRTGLAAARTRLLRARLARLSRNRASVVVHTPRTAELIAELVPEERMLFAGYPVVPFPEPPSGDGNSSLPRLLFVGAGRHEKGLDLLLEALAQTSLEVRLDIVGKQPERLRRWLSESYDDPRVHWLDEYVSADTLMESYRSADLAVLPYRTEFSRHGGPSSVLLETVSAGLPLVTTTSLEDQLPPAYEGAVVSAPDSGDALAAALEDAVARLPRLTEAARREGPAYVAFHHSYDRYVRGLLDAAEVAKR